MEKNKNLWWGLGAVLVLALIIWAVNMNRNSVSEEGDIAEVGEESTEDVSEGSVNGGAGSGSSAAPMTYQQALTKYATARIQIKPDCQVTPNQVTYKNGTSIMLDNRSNSAKTVKLGSTYSIKAWGFKIVKLSSSTLPATWYMDCGTSQNVATILLQK